MRLFISGIISTTIAGFVLLIVEYGWFVPPEEINIPTPVVAASLSEMGYFHGNIRTATKSDIERGLRLFQIDLKIRQTGQLDDKTWELLRNVKLGNRNKETLKDMKLDGYFSD